MSVRITLDRPQEHFTNLDFLAGKVVVHLVADAAVSAVTVKLEGESRTRLSGPKLAYNNERSDKRRTELEWHKLLYKVESLFPHREAQSQIGGGSYMLSAGHHEYPFRFKFPFNNDCQTNTTMRDLKVGGVGIAFNSDLNVKHVKRTLPPSLNGFPGEAEIKYYVKATVVRPKFYQENIRSHVDIKFLPIEPPRPPSRPLETFARRKQQFAKSLPQPEKKGLFSKSSTPGPAPEPPAFQVDARLPNPTILTCNGRLPLRVLVQKLSEGTEIVFLSMLQIELIGFTHVRAHDLNRSESGSWIIMSQANINIPLGEPSDPVGKEWKVPSRYWENIPLPNTVAPTFDTCNISRTYQLEVRVGLSHGGGAGTIKPELIVLPLRLPVKIFSGIAPPPALLQRMATSNVPQASGTQLGAGAAGTSPISPGPNAALYAPPTPLTPSYVQQQPPAPLGSTTASYSRPTQLPEGEEDDAPPSYEDAMGDEIAPVDGPRRDYSVPNPTSGADMRSDGGSGPNAKSGSASQGGGIGGLGRRVSERLFPSNGIHTGAGIGSAGQGPHRSRQSSTGNMVVGIGSEDNVGGPSRPQQQGSMMRRPTLPPSFEDSANETDRR